MSEQARRSPTSHERQAGQPWDASYDDGPAPWDTGGPQPAVVRLADAGGFTGRVPTPAAAPARTPSTSPLGG